MVHHVHYDTMQSALQQHTASIFISIPKTEAVCSCKMLVHVCPSAGCYDTEYYIIYEIIKVLCKTQKILANLIAESKLIGVNGFIS